MRSGWLIFLTLLIFGSVWGIVATPVRAECLPNSDFYCTGDEACAPDGSCNAQSCCSYPPEPPPNIRCTADYQCGSGNCCKNGQCSNECGGGASQCNADYIRNCASGTKTQQLTGENFCVGGGACKDGSGNIIVGSAQTLGGCCDEYKFPLSRRERAV